MSSLCCFWCPAKDRAERAAGEKCPRCGREYETPLKTPPTTIGTYRVQAPVSRGFYGAVFRAKQESLGRTVVLKVVPRGIYEFFKKDWGAECMEHAVLAEGNHLVAAINDRFDADVDFDGATLPCHVAVLENIPGPTLQELLMEPQLHAFTPRMAAQIAADMFEILNLFVGGRRFHNDLHSGNLIVQRLPPGALRSGAIDPTIRTVAIDLGSVKDGSLSGADRLGDHAHVAAHIAALARVVHGRNDRRDVDSRIAAALRGLAEHLVPAGDAQRSMTTEDAARTLRSAINIADEPWRQPFALAQFSDGYNAQAIESWHVPDLWFDPDGRWLARTTARGPQVITGMRGCGKTMLLRALHFHARIEQHVGLGTVAGEQPTKKKGDEFVGLFASCQKLLNPQDNGVDRKGSAEYPFERLFVAYLRDAVQVLRHLRSRDSTVLGATIDKVLLSAFQVVEMPSSVELGKGEQAFDELLADVQFRLADGEPGFRLRVAPAEAFGVLADSVRAASPAFTGKYVLFLLDDVSTRYLPFEMVRQVISKLLFQHAHCAFRITTEAQALHRALFSPGGAVPADPIRDYEEFDLGNEVYRLLQEGSTRERMNFVSEILRRRGKQFSDEHYRRSPLEILGDCELEDIAQEIASSSPTSANRKRVYRGLRALQAACVGDLGDVVKLYEKILQRADLEALPVPPDKQTDCFLEHAATLIHFLNRRHQHNKGLALAFARASGELLRRSGANGGSRLRQYTKLYVRVDAGAEYESVAARLLDLLDTGVFVYDGGVPRTKTRDSDPVLQFKLSFRKMLGLASFIGLSDRDRFELSGSALKRWLENPDEAEKILLESEAKGPPPDAGGGNGELAAPAELPPDAATNGDSKRSPALTLPDHAQLALPLAKEEAPGPVAAPPRLGVVVVPRTLNGWSGRDVDTAVFALGFEERALVSAQRLLSVLKPRRAILVEYDGTQGLEIAKLMASQSIRVETVRSPEELGSKLDRSATDLLVDSSGLSKPFLFRAVRDGLKRFGRVSVVHTTAAQHYPKNDQLRARGVDARKPVSGELLARLGEDLLMGEVGPYRPVCVHQTEASPERWRGLIASASPKNDRLLYLLDWRSSDATRIFVPSPTTERRQVARASAELAAGAADANVKLVEVDTNDIEGALRKSEEAYNDFFYRCGGNVELGLTGPKIHAIAFAALAAAARISFAWYVEPRSYDRNRFTEGTGATECFDLVWETWNGASYS